VIKVTSLYRWFDGATFNHEYYNTEHMRITRSALVAFGPIRMESEKVARSTTVRLVPGQVIAGASTWFPSMAVTEAALAAALPTIGADLVNYTNIKPELFVSTVTAHQVAP
jgi:uncharacterized protein (TIGR02118 family)